MIDAERAGVSHIRAENRNERCIRIVAKARWNPWRDAPILSHQTEIVGRRTDADAARIAMLTGPHLGAAAIDRDGEIAIKADGKRGVACAIRRGRELQIG